MRTSTANPPTAAYAIALGLRSGARIPVVAGALVAGAAIGDTATARALRATGS